MEFCGAVCMEECLLKNVILRNLETICDKVFAINSSESINHIQDGVCIIDLEGIERTQFLRRLQNSGQNIGVFSICGYSFEDAGLMDWYADIIVERFWKPVRIELLLNKVGLYKQKVLLHKLSQKFGNRLLLNALIGIVKYDSFYLSLTTVEYKAFEQLLLNEGCIVTREQLLLSVRCENQYLSLSALYTLIWRIRDKVKATNFPAVINSVHGKGYSLQLGKHQGLKYLPGFEPQK